MELEELSVASAAVTSGAMPPKVTFSVPSITAEPTETICELASSCRVAPLSTFSDAALNVPVCVRCSVPPLTLAAPTELPVLESVRTPMPVLVNPPVPVTEPSNAVSPVFCVVSVPVPSAMIPAPLRSCTNWLKLFSANVAPLATVTLSLVAIASLIPVVSVPAVTRVAPV